MMWNKTRFAKLTGIEYPVIQGPFGGGLSSVALTGAVSGAGGLGSFGGQPYTAREIVDVCREIRKITDKPFNINLWVGDRDAGMDTWGIEHHKQLAELFKPYFDELGLPLPEMPTNMGPRFEEQVAAIFEAKPAVFSFVYGIPDERIIGQCRDLGIYTMGTATTVDEAVALDHAGVDAVVATGMEAGGHRVSFLQSADQSLTGTFSLIPQVADAVSIPVVAAGGIGDARGIKAAMALGADAVQIGTAFLATQQSGASDEHKRILFSDAARYTTLTKIYTGRLSRGIRNRLTEEMRQYEHLLAPYPIQGKFMGHITVESATDGNPNDYTPYWAGQSAALLKYRDARVLMGTLITEMDAQGV